MLKENLMKDLQQDIMDLSGLLHHPKDALTEHIAKIQARAIMQNLKENLEEFFGC